MNNFARAHDRYLEPPDDDPICEDGCGEVLEKDINGDWYCANKFCPLKFSGVEKEMAEALVEFMDSSHTYQQRLTHREAEIKDLRLRLAVALENTIILKCHSCDGYYNQGFVCSCGRDNSIPDKEWEELQKENK